jgi:hypothetical protein
VSGTFVLLNQKTKTANVWLDKAPHAVYAEHRRKKHGRKTSFWSRYER